MRRHWLLGVFVLACGGGSSSSHDAGPDGPTIATECLVDTPCVDSTDCANGERCNTNLPPPACQILYCAPHGAICSEDGHCQAGLSCRGGLCDCPIGQVRHDGACVPLGDVIGMDCTISPDNCPSPLACHTDWLGRNYCTPEGCGGLGSCSAGYECNDAGVTSFCERLPEGYLDSCQGPQDCSSEDGVACVTVQNISACLLGCDAESDCPDVWVCCGTTDRFCANEQLCDQVTP